MIEFLIEWKRSCEKWRVEEAEESQTRLCSLRICFSCFPARFATFNWPLWLSGFESARTDALETEPTVLLRDGREPASLPLRGQSTLFAAFWCVSALQMVSAGESEDKIGFSSSAFSFFNITSFLSDEYWSTVLSFSSISGRQCRSLRIPNVFSKIIFLSKNDWKIFFWVPNFWTLIL